MTQLESLTCLLPHPPLITSSRVNWSNFFLAYYEHPGAEVLGTTPHHVLEVIETNSRSPHERYLNGKHLSTEIQGGEIFLCPAQADHWIRWDAPLNFSVLVFEPDFFQRTADELACPTELIPQWNLVDPVIQTTVRALKADLEDSSPAGRLYGESFGTALAVHLLKNFSPARLQQFEYAGGLSPRQLKQVLDYIEAHLAEDLSLSTLATLAGVSSSYFARLFKRSLGLPPHQYVIRKRVELAARLIQQSDRAIADISLQCGFAHQSHLSRHFKRILGVAPNALRNR